MKIKTATEHFEAQRKSKLTTLIYKKVTSLS